MFSPSPTLSSRLIDALCSADLSLRDVADIAETPLEEFTLWLETDDIQTRIAALHSAMLLRTRLVCANSLPLVVTALKTILQESLHLLDRTPQDTRDLRLVSIRSRTHDSARRACGLLMRLSTINTPLNPKPRAPSPVPAATAPAASTGTPAQAAPATLEIPLRSAAGVPRFAAGEGLSPLPAMSLEREAPVGLDQRQRPQTRSATGTPRTAIYEFQQKSSPPHPTPAATSIITVADTLTPSPVRNLTPQASGPFLKTAAPFPEPPLRFACLPICPSAHFPIPSPALVELTIAESG